MAQKNNIPKELAKKFIDQFYTRYPKVKAWQEGIRAKVDMCRVPTSAEGLHGLKIGKSVIQSLTGRMYTFFEYANKEYNRQSFSPTEVINYPVQGFATGDIVPAVISELRRQLILFNLHKKSLMIMTVHDSIILDCEEEAVEETAYLVSSVCNLTSKILSKYYGIEIDQTFPIEITVGPNLLEQTHYEVSNG
jgi:DNA polymerase I-like protein with 3'-5' exonuclease and polymerase domains